MEKREKVRADLAQLEASGETQLSRTDEDARLLSKRGHTVAGYNVQIAVDDKHKLIVASEVIKDGNDTGQLHAMARLRRRDWGLRRSLRLPTPAITTAMNSRPARRMASSPTCRKPSGPRGSKPKAA
jgi:hypothetical protein